MKNNVSFLLIFGLFLFTFCDKHDPDNFLRIESRWFTIDEFFNLTPKHTFKYLPVEEKNIKIGEFIDRQLFVYKGIDEGYLKDPDIRQKSAAIKHRLLINEYFDRMVLDSILTKQLLLSEYECLNSDKKYLFTFNEYLPTIKKQLINKFSADIQSKYLQAVERLKADFEFELIGPNLSDLSNGYMNLLISLKADSVAHSAIDVLKMTGYSHPLYRIKGKDIYLENFIAAFKVYPFAIPDQFSNPEFLSNVIETVAINNIVLLKSQKLKLNKTRDFKKQFAGQENTLLYNSVFSNEILSRITITDDTLHQFYSTYLDSLYLSAPQYEVQEIFINDKDLAKTVLKKALRRENFQRLADEYTERYRNMPRKGYLGYIRANMYAGIGRCAAVTATGNIYPDLISSGKGFSIINVISVIDPKPISFDNIKGKILDDYKKTAVAELKKELLQSLRHKYTYHVNYSLLTK
ncbi:hypothetical protein KJ762_01105 [bacterium]|nr:hypothetical protein [bacterium]MBU1066033.1 hypothetical protein [bacterium]MBU1633086.1 hypothetical protein [bacterium]MBU1874294.1 hypothetical protein [bacterium]